MFIKDYEIEDLINSAGAELIFTPSLLSRESHKPELCWSKFKNFLRSYQPRTSEQLDRVISERDRFTLLKMIPWVGSNTVVYSYENRCNFYFGEVYWINESNW